MAGYYQSCNCCGREFNSAPGARAYLHHLSESTYYGIRMSPEATFALGAKAIDFLRRRPEAPTSALLRKLDFEAWCVEYYFDWKPCGPDIIPAAYGWFIP